MYHAVQENNEELLEVGFPGCPTNYSCYFMEGTTGQKGALTSMEISREAKEPSLFKSEAKCCLIVSDRAETDKIVFDHSLLSHS